MKLHALRQLGYRCCITRLEYDKLKKSTSYTDTYYVSIYLTARVIT